MKVTSSSLAALSTLPWFVAGAVKRATPEPFRLYGYNKGVGGLPLLYADGMFILKACRTLIRSDWRIVGFAYVGEGKSMNDTENTAFVNCESLLCSSVTTYSVLTFTVTESTDGTWIATLNATNSTTLLSSKNVTFMVPAADNPDRRVGFKNDSSSADVVANGFRFYGSLAAHVGDDGTLETLFTGLQIAPGVQALYWNDTSLGQSPIMIRNIAPSNPFNWVDYIAFYVVEQYVFICPTAVARTARDFELEDYRCAVATLETQRFETPAYDTVLARDLVCAKHPSQQEVSRLRSIALKMVDTFGWPRVQD
jgi:hypothetical protein